MFKAWDNKNKRWLDSFVITPDGRVIVKEKQSGWQNFKDVVVDATLCRNTGFKDIKGTDIFEHDIVKANNYTPEYYRIAFVDGGFGLLNDKIDMMLIDIHTLYPSIGCQIEVVGSVCEKVGINYAS